MSQFEPCGADVPVRWARTAGARLDHVQPQPSRRLPHPWAHRQGEERRHSEGAKEEVSKNYRVQVTVTEVEREALDDLRKMGDL